jgi:hypothetical protein
VYPLKKASINLHQEMSETKVHDQTLAGAMESTSNSLCSLHNDKDNILVKEQHHYILEDVVALTMLHQCRATN